MLVSLKKKGCREILIQQTLLQPTISTAECMTTTAKTDLMQSIKMLLTTQSHDQDHLDKEVVKKVTLFILIGKNLYERRYLATRF